MIKKTSSNQPCGRDCEYIIGAFLKSFSIGTFTNSEGPDEIPHNVAYHQSSLFANVKQIFRKNYNIF